ncbi:hypothetical protein [Ralstonia phage RpY2]|uniref:Uncharacterized protein n=1 Tax=Ralstonia phage RpY2 TaxID=2880950 RepID=A0AC61TP61_9CAUD|nr:hypothetical protein [Ralstonia phage RpY2]
MKVPLITDSVIDWANFIRYNKADVDLSINLLIQAEALKHARKVERLIEAARRAGQAHVAVDDPVTGKTIVYHIKEPSNMRITSQTRTLDQYRAVFFTKAVRQLATKVGFDLITAPDHIKRIFEDARKVRDPYYHASLRPWDYGKDYMIFRLEFRALTPRQEGSVFVAQVDAVHLLHVLDTLDRGLTQRQELEVLAEHAEKIVDNMIRHGLRKTTEAIVAAELK